MSTLRDGLIQQLWASHNEGKRSVAIRMHHKLLCYYIREDAEFFEELEYNENGWTFQTLQIKIDSWATNTPIIECEARSENQRTQTNG